MFDLVETAIRQMRGESRKIVLPVPADTY